MLLALALIFWGSVVYALVTGKVLYGTPPFYRFIDQRQNSTGFWIVVICHAAFGAVLLLISQR